MRPTIFVLNGPNLNTLGRREPQLYGTETLDMIGERCRKAGEDAGLSVEFRQSNHEGALIDWIHEAEATADGIVINPGAYGHTSIALRDALRFFGKPTIEVHLSNIHAREEFRHHTTIGPVVTGVICGFGANGYELAIAALAARLGSRAAGA